MSRFPPPLPQHTRPHIPAADLPRPAVSLSARLPQFVVDSDVIAAGFLFPPTHSSSSPFSLLLVAVVNSFTLKTGELLLLLLL